MLYNFWVTLLAELIQIQPKAPWLATPAQVKGFVPMYQNANVKNYQVMYYNVDPRAPNSKPSREQPGSPPAAIFQEIARVEQNISSTVGIKNLGRVDKVYSGEALNNMARPGDIVIFGLIDTLSRYILYTAEIINSMIPDIIDTPRDIRVRNYDETEAFEPVNTTVGKAAEQMRDAPDLYGMDKVKKKRINELRNRHGDNHPYNDITKGTYEVMMTPGRQYQTQRQESAEKLFELARHWPEIMKIAGDLIMADQDIIGSEEIAERLRKTMPAWLVPPKEGEAPRPPQPPNPKVLLEQAKIMHEKIKTMHDAIKLENEKQGKKDDVKEQILQMLQQVFGPEHPADALPMVTGQ